MSFPGQINALTSLRYLAAAWVVAFHFKEYTGSAALHGVPALSFGYLGVDFFFVLSGFVLTHVYKRDVDAGRFDYWGFVSKRFGRIYPMHLLTLGCFVVLGAVSAQLGLNYRVWDPAEPFQADRGELLRNLVAHLTLIHAWGSTNGLQFNMPSWSISAEWFAYLMFPVYMVAFRLVALRPAGKLVLAVVAFVGLAAATALLLKLELTRMTWNIGVLRIFPEFMLGAALYIFGERHTLGRSGAKLGLALSVLTVLGATIAGGFASRTEFAAIIAVLGLAGVVFCAADGDRHGVFPALSNRWFVLLGEISYSVYMLHLLVGTVVFELLIPGFRPADGLAAGATIAAALALTTAMSWVTYQFVEVPGRRSVVRWARTLSVPHTA